MRIALVYPSFGRVGGVERVVYEAARYLALRHDVTVICRVAAGSDLTPAVRQIAVGGSARSVAGLVAFRLAAGRALQRLNLDKVVAFGTDCPTADVLVVGSVHAAWLKRGRPVKYGPLTVPPTFRRLLPRHQVRLRLEAMSIARLGHSRVVPVSEGTAEDLVQLYGIPRSRIAVVPNGFDPEQFSPGRRSELRRSLPAQYRHLVTGRTIVMVANEWHRKGLGVLLEAMSRVAELRLKLVLVGRLPLGGYERQVRELGLQEHVHYLGPMEDVAIAYAIGDLFVMPTQYEAFGNVIVESLASGVPVITTRLAGAASVVRPEENGLLQADPDDSSELVRLLTRALEPGILERWAAYARESVAGYEWGHVMRRLEAVITAGTC